MLCIINCQNVVIKHNTRVWREYLQQNYQIISRIISNIKKLLLFFLNNNLWLNERHVETKLRLTNLPALTNNYIKKYNGCKEYKKERSELNISTKQPNRRFIRVELALKIIMNCRANESCNLKRNLGFTLHDVINTKEQTVINSVKDAFEGEDMQTQYSVLSYRIDLYFYKYKLAIEVDELGHADRNVNN